MLVVDGVVGAMIEVTTTHNYPYTTTNIHKPINPNSLRPLKLKL